ncbi:MAG: DUF5658 family protein [Acidobacteriales bacterium]|nr:DUF5658 family protein [Terriglobales bacterium]
MSENKRLSGVFVELWKRQRNKMKLMNLNNHERRLFYGSLLFMLIVEALDGLSTALALNAGAMEINPFMRTAFGIDWYNFFLLKAVLVSLTGGCSAALWKLTNSALAGSLPIILASAHGLNVVINNVVVFLAISGWI